MSTTSFRPSVRSDALLAFSSDYRQSAKALLWRAKMFRFIFLAAIGAALAGTIVYASGMLDMSYRHYPEDLYTDFNSWWLHVSILMAVIVGSFSAIVYMQQGGWWSRGFAVIFTMVSTGYLIFCIAVVGWILCECDNIGGMPAALLHPECPDLAGEPRLAFELRGWALFGMIFAMAAVAATVVFVINTVGELIALIRQQQELAEQSGSPIAGFISGKLANNHVEAHAKPHLISSITRFDRIVDFVEDIDRHLDSLDVEAGEGKVAAPLLGSSTQANMPISYTLKRE